MQMSKGICNTHASEKASLLVNSKGEEGHPPTSK